MIYTNSVNVHFIMKKISLVVCFVLFFSLGLMAQRQTAGRPALELTLQLGKGMNGFFPSVSGASVSWNVHDYSGYFSYCGDVCIHPYLFTEPEVYDKNGNLLAPAIDISFRSVDALLGGGYTVRLLSTRSRSLILSAGASAFTGIRYCKELSSYVKEYNDKGNPVYYGSVGFLVVVIPELKAEVFPFSNVSLFASFRPRFEVVNGLVGSYEWFSACLGAGAKYYF